MVEAGRARGGVHDGGACRSSACRARAFLCPSARAWPMARWEGGRSITTTTPLTSPCARTSTHVHVRVSGTSSPDLRDVTRLARVSASRDRVHHAAAHLGGVVRRKGDPTHIPSSSRGTCVMSSRRRPASNDRVRLLGPRGRPASSEQARRVSSVVSHLEGRRAERRQLQQPHRQPSPCPCKAAAPKGPAFCCFLNYCEKNIFGVVHPTT